MSWLPKSGYFISRNRSLLHSIGGHCPLMQEGVRLTKLLSGLSELGNNKGTAEAGLMFIFDFLQKLIIG